MTINPTPCKPVIFSRNKKKENSTMTPGLRAATKAAFVADVYSKAEYKNRL